MARVCRIDSGTVPLVLGMTVVTVIMILFHVNLTTVFQVSDCQRYKSCGFFMTIEDFFSIFLHQKYVVGTQ